MDLIELAIHYHLRTKHHFNRYAASLGYLDWATQPHPFRRFEGARTVRLALSGVEGVAGPSYDDLFEPGRVKPSPLTLETFSAFFEFSLALSAWKQHGQSRWSLRINPSSGNLHPTEGYLVTGPVSGLCDRGAVFHYTPEIHALECRSEFDSDLWAELIEPLTVGAQSSQSGRPHGDFHRNVFLVGLTSIHWRESWKYGERAYRYCQHDAGHALAALSLAAAMHGWSACYFDGVSDADIRKLLGLDRATDFPIEAEREQPDLLLAVIPEQCCPPEADFRPVECGTGLQPAECATGFQPVDFDAVRTKFHFVRMGLSSEAIIRIAAGDWRGIANRLSADYVEWEIIDAVAQACEKTVPVGQRSSLPNEPAEAAPGKQRESLPCLQRESLPYLQGDSLPCLQSETLPYRQGGSLPYRQSPPTDSAFPTSFPPARPVHPARKIIFQRRSALDFDGQTSISAEEFYFILDRVLPRFDRAPWNALGPPACVHLGLFVHLVRGISPGLYFLIRRDGQRESLPFRSARPDRIEEFKNNQVEEFKGAMRSDFRWEKPAGCPDHLPLYLLLPGDARRVAGQVSCGQAIAADGAFSLGMIAEFEPRLREQGAWFYRRLFWETGVIGQVLYLEAEAAGIRATGIGCFFDDPVHSMFGFEDLRFQSLYHFTMGGPVEDIRLRTTTL